MWFLGSPALKGTSAVCGATELSFCYAVLLAHPDVNKSLLYSRHIRISIEGRGLSGKLPQTEKDRKMYPTLFQGSPDDKPPKDCLQERDLICLTSSIIESS